MSTCMRERCAGVTGRPVKRRASVGGALGACQSGLQPTAPQACARPIRPPQGPAVLPDPPREPHTPPPALGQPAHAPPPGWLGHLDRARRRQGLGWGGRRASRSRPRHPARSPTCTARASSTGTSRCARPCRLGPPCAPPTQPGTARGRLTSAAGFILSNIYFISRQPSQTTGERQRAHCALRALNRHSLC